MKLRTIYLSLYEYPEEISGPFSFETRCLCNYVQRPARKMKIVTEGFNKIVIQGDPSPDEKPRIVSEKCLLVPFVPDLERYKSATDDERQEYFIEILTKGLNDAHQFYPLPLPDLLRIVEEFQAAGYRNCWTHQSKLLRGYGLRAELNCELTMHEFNLTLCVSRKAETLMARQILSTEPDEICFHYDFKDIVVRGEDLVVTNRMSEDGELIRIPLSDFSE